MCIDCSSSIHNKGARKRHQLDDTRLMNLGFSTQQEIQKPIIKIQEQQMENKNHSNSINTEIN